MRHNNTMEKEGMLSPLFVFIISVWENGGIMERSVVKELKCLGQNIRNYLVNGENFYKSFNLTQINIIGYLLFSKCMIKKIRHFVLY